MQAHIPSKVIFKNNQGGSGFYASSEALWISQKCNNGDFDFYYVLEIHEMKDFDEQATNKYGVEVSVIAPEQFEDKNGAMHSCGDVDDMIWDTLSVERKIEIIHGYAGGPHVFSKTGNNLATLIREARKELSLMSLTFGFKMDQTYNGVGATGWDLLKGNFYPEDKPEGVNDILWMLDKKVAEDKASAE